MTTLNQEMSGRVPPQALEVEKQVLSEMLCDENGVVNAIQIVHPSDFYKPAHQIIFSAIMRLFERSEPVDSITLTEELRREGKLDQIGGPLYISDLTVLSTSSANVEYHAKIVLEKSILRQIISAGNEMASRAFNENDDALELLGEAEDKVLKIAGVTKKDFPKGIDELTYGVVEKVDRIRSGEMKYFGLPTGFKKLDEYIGGLKKKNLYIVAARPSVGKSAFCFSIMMNMNVPALLFSAEMGSDEVTLRMLSQESKISFYRLENGFIHSEHDVQQYLRAQKKLVEKKMFIDDAGAPSIFDIKSKTKRMIVDNKIEAVFVDYLQLLSSPKKESREQEVSFISKSLKQMAKDFDIPVVVLSQLNRAVEGRSDKRPVLSDLRESGSIEQDADVVIFPHRDKMDANVRPELIIGKNRNGQTGAFDVTFIGDIMRFENYEDPRFDEKF